MGCCGMDPLFEGKEAEKRRGEIKRWGLKRSLAHVEPFFRFQGSTRTNLISFFDI